MNFHSVIFRGIRWILIYEGSIYSAHRVLLIIDLCQITEDVPFQGVSKFVKFSPPLLETTFI